MADIRKTIHLRYHALLREERGCAEEHIETQAATPLELYKDLQMEHRFWLAPEALRVAINDSFVSWTHPLNNNDTVVFIPPVSGG